MPVITTWSFDLRIAGAELTPDEISAIQQIRVVADTRALGSFEIILDAWDPDKQVYRLLDSVKLGAKVEIGIRDQRQTRHPLFVGELTALDFELAGEQSPTLSLRGYDLRHRLKRGRRTRAFENSKDSEIAEAIAQAAGVKLSATASPITHPYILQADQTDYDFLSQRAAAIGYEFVPQGETLLFRPIKADGPKSAELDLSGDVLEFRATCSLLSQVDQVEVRGWDPAQKQAISVIADTLPGAGTQATGPAHAKKVFGAARATRCDLAVASIAEAEALAKSTLLHSALEHVIADLVTHGDPLLVAGARALIKGAGTRFGSLYSIESATHILTRDDSVYETHLKLRKLAS